MALKSKSSGLTLAAAAAGLLMAGCAATGNNMSTASADVHCTGINGCKGQTSCKSAKNNCKGQNSCKGQGWLSKSSKADCEAAGGSVL